MQWHKALELNKDQLSIHIKQNFPFKEGTKIELKNYLSLILMFVSEVILKTLFLNDGPNVIVGLFEKP